MDCTTIIDAVARRSGIPATDLEPPLYEVVDPDALDTLLAADGAGRSPVHVEFTYGRYDVAVSSDGGVTVAERRSS